MDKIQKMIAAVKHAVIGLTVIRGLLALAGMIPWVHMQWMSFLYEEKVGIWLRELPWSQEPLSYVAEAYRIFFNFFGLPALLLLCALFVLHCIPVWKLNQLWYWIKSIGIRPPAVSTKRVYVRCLNEHGESDVDIQRLKEVDVGGVTLTYVPKEGAVYASGVTGSPVRLREIFRQIDGIYFAVCTYNP